MATTLIQTERLRIAYPVYLYRNLFYIYKFEGPNQFDARFCFTRLGVCRLESADDRIVGHSSSNRKTSVIRKVFYCHPRARSRWMHDNGAQPSKESNSPRLNSEFYYRSSSISTAPSSNLISGNNWKYKEELT